MSEAVTEPGKPREYVVLRELPIAPDQHRGDWVEVERVEATSARAAIAKAFTEDGEYVAIPARSFQPQTVKTEQKATLKWG